MNFNDAYRYGMQLPSIGKLFWDLQLSSGDCRRGFRSALLFRLLAGGLSLDEAGKVLGPAVTLYEQCVGRIVPRGEK